MPRGRPTAEEGSDPRTNKSEAVRRAMDNLGYDASPSDIQKFIKDNFDQDMSTNMISSYKSSERSKKGLAGRRKKRGRPRKTVSTESAPVSHGSTPAAVPWKDLRTIKDIVGRIGKKGLRELVELLD